jgi:hypothetical protein
MKEYRLSEWIGRKNGRADNPKNWSEFGLALTKSVKTTFDNGDTWHKDVLLTEEEAVARMNETNEYYAKYPRRWKLQVRDVPEWEDYE